MSKRLFDVVLSGLGLLVLALPIFILSGLVLFKLGRPVLFRQMRPGLHGRPFQLMKFRTMTNEREADGSLMPDEKRLTPFGRFLRSSSIDELPQLFNVLRGEMSLVGPRPLLLDYLPLYSAEQARRHEVRPGITGWAQVNGRNTISLDARLILDVWYVDHRNLWLDIKILWLTIRRVLAREGVNATDQALMSGFSAKKNRKGIEK